jgi:pimeloyl-ACP methyl ester carboxylesterase
VYAHVYGVGDRGMVPAHGGRFNKESWDKQARTLAAAGLRVLALDFRGYGKSRGPGQSDPLSAPLQLGCAGRYPLSARHRRKERVGSRGKHGSRSCWRCVDRLAAR